MKQEKIHLLGRLRSMASLQRMSRRSTPTEARAAVEIECKLEEWENTLRLELEAEAQPARKREEAHA